MKAYFDPPFQPGDGIMTNNPTGIVYTIEKDNEITSVDNIFAVRDFTPGRIFEKVWSEYRGCNTIVAGEKAQKAKLIKIEL